MDERQARHADSGQIHRTPSEIVAYIRAEVVASDPVGALLATLPINA
jgi:hypothetical protein